MDIKKVKRFKVHKEGTGLLTAMGVVFLVINVSTYNLVGAGLFFFAILLVSIVFYLLTINFFRFPRRITSYAGDSNAIVSPADGKIVAIEEVEEREFLNRRCLQVSVFMSVLNVHANWCPCHGQVLKTAHQSGRFMAAYLPKSSTENERSAVLIETKTGLQVLVRQIAGALARRIVTYSQAGEECGIDEPLGFIKFGSRVDLYLPLGTEVMVSIGEAVRGNQTLIGRLPQGHASNQANFEEMEPLRNP